MISYRKRLLASTVTTVAGFAVLAFATPASAACIVGTTVLPSDTLTCGNTTATRLQENDSTALKAKGDANPTTQVVVGFSVGAYVGKSNGVASPNPQTDGVGVAAINNDGAGNNIGLGYTGSAPNLVPASSFYNNAVFGRTVYNVVPTIKIDSANGNLGLKNMFKDPDGTGALQAAICQEVATIQKFGFLVSATCGNTALKGSFLVGQSN